MKKVRMLSVLSAAVIAVSSLASVGMTATAASVGDKLTVGNGRNQWKDNCDGYSYEIWLDNTGGSGSMTLGKGATFKAEWNASVSSGNYLARRGLSFGSTKKATDYDYIGMDYEATYDQTGSWQNQGNSRLCVYGWFENRGAAGNPPLVEYYIIEDWIAWCPDSSNYKMVTIDGAQYKVFQLDHTGPDIHGQNSTFKQYYSVRQTKRTSGHITVSDHFKVWADQGWGIGNLYEVALNAEGWQSSGIADVTKLDVYTKEPEPGQTTTPVETMPVETTPPVEVVTPSGSGTGITDDFEGNGTSWTNRGDDCTYGFTSEMAHGGSKSLYVSGRTGAWNGFTVPGGQELKAGETYNISAFAAYKNDSYSSVGFTLGIQYDLSGKTNYDNLVDADATSGKWTELATEFTVPAGAESISLYLQTAYTENPTAADLLPFYLDDVTLTGSAVQTTVTTTTTPAPVTTTTEPATTPAPATTTPAPVTTTEPVATTTPEPVSTTTTTVKEVEVSLIGDADCSGEVDISDAVLVARYNVEDKEAAISDVGLLNADVNKSGKPDSDDVMMIVKAVAHLITL